jgi:hypothetical protein
LLLSSYIIIIIIIVLSANYLKMHTEIVFEPQKVVGENPKVMGDFPLRSPPLAPPLLAISFVLPHI